MVSPQPASASRPHLYDESQWASVFYREWLAVMRVCKERILGGKVVEGHVCCPAVIVRVNKHVSSGVSDFRAVQNLARGDALPKIVKSRPARHAVKIRLHLHTWQRLELLPSPFHRFFHKSQNFEFPLCQIDLGRAPGIKNRPLQRSNLVGR